LEDDSIQATLKGGLFGLQLKSLLLALSGAQQSWRSSALPIGSPEALNLRG
jgi:hypothetical protein